MTARVFAILVLFIAGPGHAFAAAPSPVTATCGDCHQQESQQFQRSVHPAAGAECTSCHGGEPEYEVDQATLAKYAHLVIPPTTSRPGTEAPALPASAPATTAPDRFDHGPSFTGRPSRREVPARCGSCHSDVSKMNPYGIPTDQVAQHRASGHGRALFDRNNEKAAVCIDCHGTHEILHIKDPNSSVYPKNVPATCGRCHADPEVMKGSGLSTRVLAEYKESVHGRGLLEGGDVSMPHCAVCHGSHSAVPPGFQQVGHVCGRCHPQETKNFLDSVHAKFEYFPRCVACHTRGADLRDHRILRIVASPKTVEQTYEQALAANPGLSPGDPALREAFQARLVPPQARLEPLCRRCHNPSRQVGHRSFFANLDEEVMHRSADFDWTLQQAELGYASTSSRVDHVGRGVLLVTEEALMRDDLRTKLVELRTTQHTLDPAKIKAAAGEVDALATQINQSLDEKEKGLRLRHLALWPMWIFIVLFGAALWVKYKRLKGEMVVHEPRGTQR